MLIWRRRILKSALRAFRAFPIAAVPSPPLSWDRASGRLVRSSPSGTRLAIHPLKCFWRPAGERAEVRPSGGAEKGSRELKQSPMAVARCVKACPELSRRDGFPPQSSPPDQADQGEIREREQAAETFSAACHRLNRLSKGLLKDVASGEPGYADRPR